MKKFCLGFLVCYLALQTEKLSCDISITVKRYACL